MDERFDEVGLKPACNCAACQVGNQLLRAHIALDTPPLPIAFYQCLGTGGMLDIGGPKAAEEH